MQNYDFMMLNCRFHLFEENKLVFLGVYRDDNPDKRELEVYLDEELMDVAYKVNKGIDIRQKYLSHKANVSKEIVGSLYLPKNWEQKKNFRIICVCKKDGVETRNTVSVVPVRNLAKMKNSVSYSIENVTFAEEVLTVTGWAFAEADVEIQLLQGSTKIPCEIERTYRKDIKLTFDELPLEYKPAFKLQATVPNMNKLKLEFNCKGKSASVAIRKNGVNAGPSIIDKVLFRLRHYGLKMTILKCVEKLLSIKELTAKQGKKEYELWRKKYAVKKEELEVQRTHVFDWQPKFSIVIPLYDTKPEYLKELIESIQNQTYTNWELCLADGTGEGTPLKAIVEKYMEKDARIKYEILSENKGISENTNAAIRMATGDYIVLADHDDIVPANALYECANALNEDRTIDVIYSDEDKIDMAGKKFFEPHFKSDFNIDLLCSMNYICHLFVVKKEIIDQVGMLRSEFDGAQDHDFILRCCEVAENIKHIPKILYHWRSHINSTAANPESKLYAFDAGRKAVEAHYERIGVPATVEHAEYYGMYKTIYHWKEQPLVSIIIPNKDHSEDLRKIMDSIDEKSTYCNYEFVIVENNSTDAETFAYYKEIEKRDNVQVLYYDGIFNYSKINNFGASKAKGDYFLLLNNDTELISPDGLEQMLYICMREDVGIVGAKLCYSDDTIQHAGVILGLGGIAGHAFIESSRFDVGYVSRIACTQDLMAVTAACLMVKREIYEQVGGLTEEFQIAFNDIDFCMKVRALGKLVVYTPYAELYHYESKSRGAEDTPEKVERFNSEVARFIEKWNKELLAGDPYYNPNLTLDRADFSLKD